ncbi:MAG TPA: MFS transporter [Sedimentisphaerales bacterium]|nr:MFS transporter [Sedimentisphaerales bacterium]
MDEKLVARVLSYRWLLFAVLAAGFALVYFHRVSLSVVADELRRDFQTSASVIGLLGSVYFYCYAFMQIPSGLLSDSVGPRKTVAISLLLATVGGFLFGLAPTIGIAVVARAMVGIGVSMVFIPSMKVFSQWFRAREFAHVGGMFQSAGGIGILAGTWLLSLLSVQYGWRTSFQIIATATLAIALAAWVFVRNRPTDKGWPSITQIERQEDRALPVAGRIGLRQGIRMVLSEKHFWLVGAWFFFDCGIFFGFGNLWSGPYLMHVYGITRDKAATLLSMIAWGMVFGGPALGVLSQRLLKSRRKTLILCMSALTILLLAPTLLPAGLPRGILLTWFFLFSVCSSAVVVVAFTTAKELFPLEIAGTSIGIVNFFPFFGGAVYQPVLGAILDVYGKTSADQYPVAAYQMVMLVLLLSSLAALVCSIFLKDTYPK